MTNSIQTNPSQTCAVQINKDSIRINLMIQTNQQHIVYTLQQEPIITSVGKASYDEENAYMNARKNTI